MYSALSLRLVAHRGIQRSRNVLLIITVLRQVPNERLCDELWAPSFWILTTFWSDHQVALCWPVECTMMWVGVRHPNECHLHHFIAADIPSHQWTCAIEDFARNQYSAPWPCLWGKHGVHSSGFFHGIIIMILNTFLERWIPLWATNLRLKALYMFN